MLGGRSWRGRSLKPALGKELTEACLAAIEDEARERSLRDPHDWPVVATALALSAAIWTNDNDFLGIGIATRTTDSLQRWLQRQPHT